MIMRAFYYCTCIPCGSSSSVSSPSHAKNTLMLFTNEPVPVVLAEVTSSHFSRKARFIPTFGDVGPRGPKEFLAVTCSVSATETCPLHRDLLAAMSAALPRKRRTGPHAPVSEGTEDSKPVRTPSLSYGYIRHTSLSCWQTKEQRHDSKIPRYLFLFIALISVSSLYLVSTSPAPKTTNL